MPTVSVVLPVYNAAQTIARAVRSILDQTLTDFELIVVDDGSTDGTASVIERFPDPRLKLIQAEHAGVTGAANLGVRHATASVLARMDADDFAYPERLQRQLQLLSEFDVVGCQVQILNEDGSSPQNMQRYQRWINEDTKTPQQIMALRFVEFPLVNPTIMARRAYFEMGFRHNDFPEDYDLMLRAASRGMTFGKVNQVLLDWTDSAGRLTRNDDRYSDRAFMNCRRQHLRDGPLANVTTVDLWGVGQTGKPWLRWLLGQRIAVRRAIEVNPRKIGKRIHEVPVIDADALPPADGVPLIIAVGADGARSLIEQHIVARGYVAGVDAWYVA